MKSHEKGVEKCHRGRVIQSNERLWSTLKDRLLEYLFEFNWPCYSSRHEKMLGSFYLKINNSALNFDLKTIQILLLLDFIRICYSFTDHFQTLDGTTAYEIPTSDVFFEIVEPKELAYTYKIRPAQDFGTTFNETFSVKNIPLVPADPPYACDVINNKRQLYRNIALVERGECSFLTKTINVEKAGALAIIVSDYDKDNDEIYIEMIDDKTLRPVNIPAGFLLGKNGYIIKSTLKKLNRNFALINLPVNITHLPLNKFNQPPWVGW